MSDENQKNELEKETCLCKSKAFRKFILIASGTFVGVFCALSLFAALHKPPVMHPAPFGAPMMQPCPCHCQHYYQRDFKERRCDRGDRPLSDGYHHKQLKGDFQKQPPKKAE